MISFDDKQTMHIDSCFIQRYWKWKADEDMTDRVLVIDLERGSKGNSVHCISFRYSLS